ncbi:MAG: secondary thiamine-phosphate synthase enzyme YjbQ [Elusimicrobiota bacterium]
MSNKIINEKIELRSRKDIDIKDITSQIEEFVKKNKIETGQVTVFTQGSTGAVTVIEFEPNLVQDFKNRMEQIAPSDMTYEHKKTWNDDNGHSHIRASVIGCSETVPVVNGQLMLGTWQQVVIVDFDTKARKRIAFLSAVK